MHEFMHACPYLCMHTAHARMHACINALRFQWRMQEWIQFACMDALTCMHARMRQHVCMPGCMQQHACMHVCMHACMHQHACMHACMF